MPMTCNHGKNVDATDMTNTDDRKRKAPMPKPRGRAPNDKNKRPKVWDEYDGWVEDTKTRWADAEDEKKDELPPLPDSWTRKM